MLDFGLATAVEDRSGVRTSNALDSPTITSPLTLTELGVILGTAAYMSPEQAKGVIADRRSDIWAFGCVLYEMLTGSRTFDGDDVTETLASVIKSQPDWNRLPASLPSSVRALLQGCLEKDRRKRIGDISVARFVLERAAVIDSPVPSRKAPHTVWRSVLLTIAAAALGAAGGYLMRGTPSSAPVTRFTIQTPPQGQELAQARRALTISPDGRRIVYAADGRLFVRSVDQLDAQPIVGTESGLQPVFSPDGQSIAFWAEGVVKRMSLAGGVPAALHNISPAPFGLDWGEHGIIVTDSGKGILRDPTQWWRAIIARPVQRSGWADTGTATAVGRRYAAVHHHARRGSIEPLGRGPDHGAIAANQSAEGVDRRRQQCPVSAYRAHCLHGRRNAAGSAVRSH